MHYIFANSGGARTFMAGTKDFGGWQMKTAEWMPLYIK